MSSRRVFMLSVTADSALASDLTMLLSPAAYTGDEGGGWEESCRLWYSVVAAEMAGLRAASALDRAY